MERALRTGHARNTKSHGADSDHLCWFRCINEKHCSDNRRVRRKPTRNPLFTRRRFNDNVIIRCVRWYLRFKLSYRDMAEIALELGVNVAPCTILRWVVRYAEEFAKRWLCFEQSVGRSWRADETYVKVNGGWMFFVSCCG